MTTQRQAIAAALTVIRELDAGESTETPADTHTVLHLGHPSDEKFNTVEEMTAAEYKRFVWLHTWPRPRGVRG